MRPRRTLDDEAVAHVLDAKEAGPRTPEYARAVREVAEIAVDLRSVYEYEGHPDWSGQSKAYRDHMSQIYIRAGLTTEERKRFGATLRYHVNNILHERLDDKERRRLGLSTQSAQERSRARDRRRDDAQRVISGEDIGVARTLAFLLVTLQGIETDQASRATKTERKICAEALDSLGKEIDRLSKAINR